MKQVEDDEDLYEEELLNEFEELKDPQPDNEDVS